MYEALIKAVKGLINALTAYLLGKKTEQVKQHEKQKKTDEKARKARYRAKHDKRYQQLLDKLFKK